MPTNSKKLRGRMIEKGFTQLDMANALGITYQAFSYKLNNKSSFKVSEIMKMCEILEISDKDTYFFVNN